MNKHKKTALSGPAKYLLLALGGLMLLGMPATADAGLVVKAKAGPVTVKIGKGRCGCRKCRTVSVVSPRRGVRRVATFERCGKKVTLRDRHRQRDRHLVWVPGHYIIKKHGRRAWIPGHWKNI